MPNHEKQMRRAAARVMLLIAFRVDMAPPWKSDSVSFVLR
jgi:hypothetical protein